MKTCSCCNIEKQFSEFSRNRSKKDGLQNECKVCKKLRSAKWHVEHKGIATERSRTYREKHQDWYVAYSKKYALENKSKKSEYAKKRHLLIGGAEGRAA